MAQAKILLDSNSYFRIASDLHPLLGEEFGDERLCLYVLQELMDEWDRSRRLTQLFPWVSEPEFIENRNRKLVLSKQESAKITQSQDFIFAHAKESESSSIARTDAIYLAYGVVLGIPVVTDDSGMRDVAAEFSVTTISTLGLIKKLSDIGEIADHKVEEIAKRWIQDSDCPSRFNIEMREFFSQINYQA